MNKAQLRKYEDLAVKCIDGFYYWFIPAVVFAAALIMAFDRS